jgi:cation diffusion facilitator family transporter
VGVTHEAGHDHDHGADHGHRHDHGQPWWRRLAHLAKPHSHDSADRIDTSLSASRLGLRTLWWSFAVLLATAAGQAVIVAFSGSVALLSDTVHNIADALTAVPLAIAFLLGRRGASRRFTYGLGRTEDIAGLIILVLIAASAVFAGWEAIDRLIHPREVHYLGLVAIAGVIGFVGNEAVALWRIRVGKRIGSAALVADGLHARTDGLTSLAVVLGAAGVAIGWEWADPVVGLGITVAITLVLWSAVRQVFGRLLDAVDPELVSTAERTIAATAGVVTVDEVRLRWVGHSLHAEASIGVDPAATLGDAHRIAHEAEHALTHAIARLETATIHINPAGEAHHHLDHHAQPHNHPPTPHTPAPSPDHGHAH